MTTSHSAKIAELLHRSSLDPPLAQRLAGKLEQEKEPHVFAVREVIESLHAVKDLRSLFAIARILVKAEFLAILDARQIGVLRIAVRDCFREQDAISLMRVLIRHLPEVAKAWIDYGTMHEWQGNYWKARRCFLVSLRLRGDREVILPKLTSACRRLARLDEATAWLKTAKTDNEVKSVRAERECIEVFRSFVAPAFSDSWEGFKASTQTASAVDVLDLLRASARDRLAISLIGLGDVEGNLIAYYRNKSNLIFSEYCRAAVRIIYENNVKDYRRFADAIQTDLEAAIHNAGIVSVSTSSVPHQVQRYGVDRQLAGNLTIARELISGNLRPPRLCSVEAHYSSQVLGFLRECLLVERRIGLVTNRLRAAKILSEKYACVTLFDIHSRERAALSLPDFAAAFRQLHTSVDVEYPGQVFVVSAGLSGKMYCEAIRAKGGIAIDVGGVLDAWVVELTRDVQNAVSR